MAPRPHSATVTLPSDTEILITRQFEAPRLLVWETFTTPRHLLRWWGPAWCPLVRCELDLRPGGSWRYESRHQDGTELAWYGTYREIVAPERIVSTEVFEPFPEAEATSTMTLSEADRITTLRTLVQHRTREARDGHVDSGMESGMQDTFDRLDDLLVDAGTPRGRFHRAAEGFGERVGAVSADAWDAPAPCEGWSARDVVGHLAGWVAWVLQRGDVELGPIPPAADDPAATWRALAAGLDAALADPVVAAHEFDVGPPGRLTVERTIDMLVTPDVLVHTWDLARATGLDEHLDAELVHGLLEGMEPLDDLLRSSGQYGPRVAVPDDADEQTRLIAFTGRRP
jgi:uncharacterized protein (TIGR03086 family)